jgi:hypothetical protein
LLNLQHIMPYWTPMQLLLFDPQWQWSFRTPF